MILILKSKNYINLERLVFAFSYCRQKYLENLCFYQKMIVEISIDISFKML